MGQQNSSLPRPVAIPRYRCVDLVPALKKNVNCIPNFEKVLQLGPFQTELTNVVNNVPRVSMWFLKFYFILFICFFILFYFFENKNKNATCQVLVYDTWHCQCHVALKCHMLVSLSDAIVLISIQSQYMSFCFNLVPTYVYPIQFCPNFLIIKIFL